MESTMINDEVMQELITLLRENNMKCETNDTFDICNYIDGLQDKISGMQIELDNMQQQLKQMEKDKLVNKLKAQLSKAQTKVSNTFGQIKTEFFIIKNSIKSKASNIVCDFKKKGRSALNKIYEVFDVKDQLVSMRVKVKESQEDVAHALDKIDAFAVGMSEASHIFKNTFRELFDKKAKDYSKIDKRIKMSDLFKKSWMAKQSILESMEKRIDRAIVKVDSLHKEAELNNMLKLYDRLESRIECTKEAVVMPMVAENEAVYGADAFDKYMENYNATMQSKDKADRIAGNVAAVKYEGKRR